jgi:membrane protease YdiL (CAAX protease family)
VGSLLDPRGRWQLFLRAIGITLVFSAALVPAFIWAGDLTLNIRDGSYYLSKMPKVIIGAVLTAFIEEFIFRGILFRELKARHSLLFATVLTTVIYASVHFIAPNKSWVYPGYSLTVGFEYLGVVFQGILNPQHLMPFLGLCLVGLVLIRSFLLTESLVVAVGLHAGWILSVKSVFYLTALSPETQLGLSSLATRYFLVSSPIGWLSVLLVGITVSVIFKKK